MNRSARGARRRVQRSLRDGLRRKRRAADPGRPRHPRLVRGLGRREAGVRGRERAEAAHPPGRRRRRGREPGAPHRRRPPRATSCSGSTTTSLARALAGDVFEPYESPELASVDPALVLDRSIASPRSTTATCASTTTRAGTRAGGPRRRRISSPSRCRATATSSSSRTRRRRRPASPSCSRRSPQFGDRWQGYWRKLRANGVLVVDGWEDAYYCALLRLGGEQGEAARSSSRTRRARPRRSSSRSRGRAPLRRRVVEASCFRQVEFAGVLRGAKQRGRRAELVDFMLSQRFQEDIPLQMFVFPARTDASLPAGVRAVRRRARAPARAAPEEIGAEPRELGGPVDRHRRAVSRRTWRAVRRRAPRLPRAVLRLPAGGHPRSRLRGAGDSAARRPDRPLDAARSSGSRSGRRSRPRRSRSPSACPPRTCSGATGSAVGASSARSSSCRSCCRRSSSRSRSSRSCPTVPSEDGRRSSSPTCSSTSPSSCASSGRSGRTSIRGVGEAAATLGASPGRRAREITLPLLAPALAAAAAIVFLFTFTSFGSSSSSAARATRRSRRRSTARRSDCSTSALPPCCRSCSSPAWSPPCWVATRLERRLVVTGGLRARARHAPLRPRSAGSKLVVGAEPRRARALPRAPARRPRRAVARRRRRVRARRLPGARGADERSPRRSLGGDRELARCTRPRPR